MAWEIFFSIERGNDGVYGNGHNLSRARAGCIWPVQIATACHLGLYQGDARFYSQVHGSHDKKHKIGQAAQLLVLETYVLRFWETEFPQLVPRRNGKGQRCYTSEHLTL